MSVRAHQVGGGLLVSWQFHDDARELAARLGQAQRLGNLGWSEWDLVTGAVRWSGQLYALFGRAPGQEVPPAAFTDLVVPEDRALAENCCTRSCTAASRPMWSCGSAIRYGMCG